MILLEPLYLYTFLGLLCLYIFLQPFIIYLRDPLHLRRYPSPSLLASLTPLWLIRATWSQNRSRILHVEFQKHGDVLRVSPTHLIFNDPAAIKDIYGVLALSQGVAKDEFYDRLAGEAHDLVQLRDRGEHSSRRKAIANAFAAKTVVNMEGVIRNALRQLLENVDRWIEIGYERPLNLRLWLNFFTLDVIGDTGFGQSMGFLKQLSDCTETVNKSGERYRVDSLINHLHAGVRYSLTMANVPWLHVGRILRRIVTNVQPLAVRLGSTCADDFENICTSKLLTRIQNGPPSRTSGDFMNFIFEDQLRTSDQIPDAKVEEDLEIEEKEEGMEKKTFSCAQFATLVADSQMVMNAGSDTTAAALTSTLWFLMKTPHALKGLRDELRPLFGQMTAEEGVHIFPYDVVKDLPYLRACIDESLRLRPPIAYQLPRLASRPVTIAGHDILPGTVVAVAPYSIHRHPSLFRDPDEYKPERWLKFDAGFPRQIEDLKRYNIVFSQGSRACIGRHLAVVELQILISTMAMRYDITLVGESKTELRVFERFNSNPGPMYINIKRSTDESSPLHSPW